MKNFFVCIIVVACAFSATAQSNGCSKSAAGWGSSLGKVAFKTNRTWKVGKQEWSDVVVAPNCQKTTYSGGSAGSFNADCRQNAEGGSGSLFSWCAVVRFQKQLCPKGWTIPTKDDFVTLQKTLADIQQINSKKNAEPVKKYTYFGPVFESYCAASTGELDSQGSFAMYWSQSEYDKNYGFHLSINISDDIYSQAHSKKSRGFAVRCVKALPKAAPVQVDLPKD